ncbi:M20 family metallopeptidase [Caenispirillum salinarum]|uniref:M20 family metallopeptidase n=1 Tax=Caenispirillum salinarum TaxID=859058 RepID=UPI00384E0C71
MTDTRTADTLPTDANILASADAEQAEAVDLLQDLVREPSTLGNEGGAQDIMAGVFGSLGLTVDRFEVDLNAISHLPGFSPPLVDYSGRENVVGVSRPAGAAKGRSLILNGHIDVVPVGNEGAWSNPPFQPVVRDGRLYGRGSGDMKAGIVAYVAAMRALARLGYRPAADVFLQSVIEEECTGNGALSCLHRGYRADAAIIPEPFNHSLMTAQLGVMWFTVDLAGKPAHVLDTSAGSNAIEAVHPILRGLKELEARWNEPPHRHPAYEGHTHPINFNLGRIQGGDWPSSVPATCRFDLRVGFFPGADMDQVKAEVEAAIRQHAPEGMGVTISYRGFQAEGAVMDPEWPMMKELSAVHEAVAGSPIEHLASTATTDARFFVLYGDTPATCYGPEADSIHGIDESVSLDSMATVTRVLALFIARWCGLERID